MLLYVRQSLYAFFCVITRRLDFICRRFGTHPKESIQYTEHGESLKLRRQSLAVPSVVQQLVKFSWCFWVKCEDSGARSAEKAGVTYRGQYFA